MSKILVFGSINIDQVFTVPNIVRPGETLSSLKQEIFAGGKGANQSVAVARAGGNSYHFGKIGCDGAFIVNQMKSSGVNTSFVQESQQEFTGRATIQVCQKTSENAIILSSNTNYTINLEVAEDKINSLFGEGDWLVLQNEVMGNEKIVEVAKAKGMKTVFNPAPMTSEIVQKFLFDKIDVIIVNQIEFEALVQGHNIELSENIEQTANSLLSHPKFKNCKLLVITLGSSGVCYLLNQAASNTYKFSQLPIIPPPSAIKDTTGAGDTFIGHFIANLAKFTPNGEDISSLKVEEVNTCAKFGMGAASIGITVEGAMNSIPDREQVVKLLAANGEQLALFPALKLN